ncbi:MAG: hypothetical protein AAF716_04510 [Cyanobacteria bacterium P01_D01_bin.1]
MNDKLLAEQLKKTGNLMDLLNDEAFVRESAAMERACDGAVEAGLGTRNYVAQIESASPEALRRQRQAVKVLSILLLELRQWLEGWQLGLCFESVYTEAQRLIYKRLDDFMVDQQVWIHDLLVENETGLPVGGRPVREEAITKLSELLTEDGWQILANTAAKDMAEGVLQAVRLDSSPSVAA